jgi:hypothetical protein
LKATWSTATPRCDRISSGSNYKIVSQA